MTPSDLEEADFRAEARALAGIIRARIGTERPVALRSGPERVRWFWEEVPTSPDIALRLWPFESRPSSSDLPFIEDALRSAGLGRPNVVQAVEESCFHGANGTRSKEAFYIERTRPRSCVALTDAAALDADPRVFRLDEGDPCLVQDVPSYVQFATDVLVRWALSNHVLFEVAFDRMPDGASVLPTFMPALRRLGERAWLCPYDVEASMRWPPWLAAPSVADAVSLFAALPAGTTFMFAGLPSGPLWNVNLVHPVASNFSALASLRRFDAGADTLPPRRVKPAGQAAKFRQTQWVGVLDDVPVVCSRGHEMRPGIVHYTVGVEHEPALRAWAKRNGIRPLA